MESPCLGVEFNNTIVGEECKSDITTGYGHVGSCYQDQSSNSSETDKSGIFKIPSGEKSAVEQSKGIQYSNIKEPKQ
jgi:hypothetical protein